MVKKSEKQCAWEPVKLEGDIFNNDFEGLVGLEECLDYDLNTLVFAQPRKRNVKVSGVSGSNDNQPKSKKQKKQNRNEIQNDGLEQKTKKKTQDFYPSKNGSTHDIDILKRHSINENDEEMYSWSSYNLPTALLEALQDQKFFKPTLIQSLTLPPAILGRRDILGAAETGSGKTLAFGIPILTGILNIIENEKWQLNNNSNISSVKDVAEEFEDEEETSCNNVSFKKPLFALILTPTRELAVQVKNHLVSLAKHTTIRIAVVVGGMAVVKQERILSKCPEIVVATPGRLWELIQEGNPHLSKIDNIRYLAIDETDRMLEKGHFKELHNLLERLNVNENKRNQRQNFVFSATLTLVHELPKHLVVKKKLKNSKKISNITPRQKLEKIIEILGITDPKVVDITQKCGTADTLTECRITCATEEKDYYVYYFLQRHPGRTLIFCNSIGCVKRLTTLLGLLGCNSLALHASMQQRQRLKNLERFRDNKFGVLIATDVAARGLDIPSVEHVLHYQTPRTSESYVHRSGRTARASRQGITVLLVDSSELSNYLKLCRTLGRTQDLPLFPVQNNILNAVKERMKLARELDKLELQVRKANSENGWIQKAAEEMDILIDDLSTKYDSEEAHSLKKVAEIKRKQLAQLLTKSLLPKGFSGKYPLLNNVVENSMTTTEQKSETAINALISSMNKDTEVHRKKAKWLFKQKSWANETNKNDKIILNNKKKNKVKVKKLKHNS